MNGEDEAERGYSRTILFLLFACCPAQSSFVCDILTYRTCCLFSSSLSPSRFDSFQSSLFIIGSKSNKLGVQLCNPCEFSMQSEGNRRRTAIFLCRVTSSRVRKELVRSKASASPSKKTTTTDDDGVFKWLPRQPDPSHGFHMHARTSTSSSSLR